ncbi:glycosyltransferase family 2 protein [bacterium C-53]|nr:glycosyltransferase family 2 protein [Lachnospiraceae bacterium]NBI01548.1 glycosyltransferase family 2 protein [Lachnospiraceae bacterium]RKJ12853.1 glycosyltransferase family 2 protein [bacterium C-53]
MFHDRLQTPVVMIVFNRLDTTRRVFEQVRMARPLKLYIVSDAPRKHKEGEKEKVEEVRRYIESGIDWECETNFDYASENMGCQHRVASGLNFVFQKEEMAIILEDDCVPRPEFFRFCDEMLFRYKEDERIMQISGCNLVPEYRAKEPYLFSMFCSIWGWATWRRAWEKFDFSMKEYPEFRRKKIIYQLFPEAAAQIIEGEMDRVYDRRMNSWAYRWLLSRMVNSGLGITPPVNLIENVGFGSEDATHTTQSASYQFDTAAMDFPVPPRNTVYRDYIYEKNMASKHYRVNPVQRLVVRYLPDEAVLKIKKMYYKIRRKS